MSKYTQKILRQCPELAQVIHSAERVRKSHERFVFYAFLKSVYCVFERWHVGKVKKRKCRLLEDVTNLKHQKNTHPVRIIISAAMPKLPVKMASRWTRALEFALAEGVTSSKLVSFLQKNGGPARCARLAARHEAKKVRYFDDWR